MVGGGQTQSLRSQRPLSSREDRYTKTQVWQSSQVLTYNFIFFFLKKKILLAALCSMWDHSSLTRDQTHAVCIGGMES